MSIKQIFDEIAAESSTNQKMEILKKYKDNELLKRVLYLANSKRVKFYLKQIPAYTHNKIGWTLEEALNMLMSIANREFTGQNAIDKLTIWLENVSADDAYIIERIIEKDCKIGMGTTFMNKVIKDLIEDTPYMGAISFDEKKARAIFDKGSRGISQIKMDGRYCNAIIRGGEVELESRSGEATVVTGAKFLAELANFEDCVLNGELTMDGVPRYESNGIIASVIDIQSKRGERTEKETEKKLEAFEKKHGSFEKALNSIRYTVWDTISVDEYFDKSSKIPYLIRLLKVEQLIMKSGSSMVYVIESRIVNTYAEAMEHFQEVLATEVNGVPQEGTILKDENGTWKDGKPTWQIKMKLEMDVDLVIVGFNYGTKGTKNENVISSFNCESSDGLVKTRPQGIKEDMMVYITENQDKLLGKILQVKCNGLSKDKEGNYSLLYPSFVEVRDDKNTCDSLESIKNIENMVKSLTTV
jgi:ATP-dependent DNA ligase